MFGSTVLDVALGVPFVYLLLSLICSALREGVEARLRSRSLQLQRGIAEMLPGELAARLYQHPLVSSLYEGPYPAAPAQSSDRFVALRWVKATVSSWRSGHDATNLPAYIPARSFALALLDLAARGSVGTAQAGGQAPLSIESVRAGAGGLHDARVERALLMAIDTAEGKFEGAVANVQAWYDASMDRVSGWYKRETQHILFWLGLSMAVALNVDTIALVRHLATDSQARASLVTAAVQAASADVPAADSSGRLKATRERLDGLNLPIGWNASRIEPVALLAAIPGWLLTAFAITFGAPFWFDALNKLMVIRSTVKPHEKSGEEGSEDRAAPKAKP